MEDALVGVRIVDFSWGAAGPYATMQLALMGAEVIRIETVLHPDLMRVNIDPVTRLPLDPELSLLNQVANLNKLGVRLNLNKPEAVELARGLIRISDVVVESYRPGVMANLGLSYPEIKEIRPDIIMLSTSAAGSTGPEAHSLGLAPLFAALGGLGDMTGYLDGPPTEIRFTIDFMCAITNAFALLAALNHRRRTGQGQFIDISSREEISCLIGDSLMDYTMNGRVQSRSGNRDDIMAPHNCYRCKGQDKWLSIAVSSEREWQAFSQAIGYPEWVKAERFSDVYGRWENQDELDRLVEHWTLNHTTYEAMEVLQKAGVAAFPSLNAEEFFTDSHTNARELFQVVEHPKRGACVLLSPMYKLSASPARITHYAPLLGEHNRYVFHELLGVSLDEIPRLEKEEVIY